MNDMVCEECGSHGEGGELEYSNGKRLHFRDGSAWVDGKIHSIMCSGRFFPVKPEEPKL